MRIPRCGANEHLNATIHGLLAGGYFLVVLLELSCLAYHLAATLEHRSRLH